MNGLKKNKRQKIKLFQVLASIGQVKFLSILKIKKDGKELCKNNRKEEMK